MWEWRPFEELNDVDIIIAKIADHQSDLSSDEFRLIASAVPSRVREFTAGRSLARFILKHRETYLKSIMIGAGGQPVWTPSISGSISHTHSHVGVAIVPRDACKGIGLDVEIAGSAAHLAKELILTPNELNRVQSTFLKDHVTKIFSCKEAVFKAVYPITEEAFEFGDIEIDVHEGKFRASMQKGGRTADLLSGGHGMLESRDDLIATIFRI
jgi:4'-phosphopantetheinyl transferase EntD